MKNTLIAITLMVMSTTILAQEKPAKDWYHQDNTATQGISVNKAYSELLQGKDSKTIIVAVIDGGVDTSHEDLESVIWTNEDEIANNGKDDDKNGYIDDIHGWNFIGGKTEDVGPDNLEITRVYAELSKKYADKTEKELSGKEKKEYKKYLAIKKEFDKRLEQAQKDYAEVEMYRSFYEASKSTIAKLLGKENYTVEEVEAIDDNGDEQLQGMKQIIIYDLQNDFTKELKRMDDHYGNSVKYAYNTEYDTRKIVGDNYEDLSEKYYGNNRVGALVPSHGTHVSGIIAADRNNNIGIKGIADNVKIMALRVVPDGDERDKDIANAVYYAVNNGAKIINMSFGKSYSPHKDAVDKAMKYASDHDVLLIHAAGNSHKLNTTTNNYPNKFIGEKKCKKIKNWIEVGAEGWTDKEHLATDFSNYGHKTVDIFAPGLDIYSTTPDNHYEFYNGTSMASPVVAGLAALIWSYYPELSAKQVKKIILKSGTDYKNQMVVVPGKEKETPFKKLSKTGRVVNAYNALKYAEKLSK